ncbi:MAG TPA: nitroreductase/quinone reductase family protein [Solirubrobacteraceae bacterium]|jgi:deazaflavin-dependent oxidoreductase (nitroreductase family)
MASLDYFYARVSPYIAHRPGSAWATKAHAWLVRRSGGRLGGRAFGQQILVLRTMGRRSGERRDAPMFFLDHEEGFAVVASNGASKRTPAWWLNLQAAPEAEALVRGSAHPVRGRAASEQEAVALWPSFVELYSGYDYYKSIATRELPVVILEPR